MYLSSLLLLFFRGVCLGGFLCVFFYVLFFCCCGSWDFWCVSLDGRFVFVLVMINKMSCNVLLKANSL